MNNSENEMSTYWVALRTAACVAGHVLQLEIEKKNNQIEIIKEKFKI